MMAAEFIAPEPGDIVAPGVVQAGVLAIDRRGLAGLAAMVTSQPYDTPLTTLQHDGCVLHGEDPIIKRGGEPVLEQWSALFQILDLRRGNALVLGRLAGG